MDPLETGTAILVFSSCPTDEGCIALNKNWILIRSRQVNHYSWLRYLCSTEETKHAGSTLYFIQHFHVKEGKCKAHHQRSLAYIFFCFCSVFVRRLALLHRIRGSKGIDVNSIAAFVYSPLHTRRTANVNLYRFWRQNNWVKLVTFEFRDFSASTSASSYSPTKQIGFG